MSGAAGGAIGGGEYGAQGSGFWMANLYGCPCDASLIVIVQGSLYVGAVVTTLIVKPPSGSGVALGPGKFVSAELLQIPYCFHAGLPRRLGAPKCTRIVVLKSIGGAGGGIGV